MTSHDLVVRHEPTDSWIEVLGPVGDLAGKIARTEFVPKGLQGNPAGVAAAILTGREMGLGPMASLRGIHIVEGRPSLTAEMLAARILAAGHQLEWKQSTDERCTVRIERADGLADAEATWTIRDAQRAGLANKKVWQSYPRHMLRWRALTEVAGMVCPDVAMGLDVDASPLAQGPAPASEAPPTVVQIAQTPGAVTSQPSVSKAQAAAAARDHDDAPTAPGPRQEPAADVVDAEVVPEPTPAPEEAMVTPAQLRKIGALIGEVERRDDRKLDRVQRRRLIGFMAGLPDPDALESANGLTRAQASTAIEALTADLAAVDAEVVDGDGVIHADVEADQ